MRNLEIKSTKDYSIFKQLEGNRQIYKNHVNKLVKAIKENPTLLRYVPILVNEELEVIDGQHRLEAAKKAKAEVYFYIEPDLKLSDTQVLNANQKSWGVMDYAKSFASLNNVDYLVYIEFRQQYPQFAHNIILQALGVTPGQYNKRTRITDRGNLSLNQAFKTGDFHVHDVAVASKFLDALLDFQPYFKQYNQRSFFQAFRQVYYRVEGYDHKRMMERMKKYPSGIANYSTVPDLMRELEIVYNYNISEEKRVRFF